MFSTPRKALLRLCLTLTGAVLVSGAAAAVPASPPLQQVALRPAQVGPGYRMERFTNGAVVAGQVTLDLCGFSFPSERRRAERLQVGYRHAKAVEFSNEVVRYRAGGAAQAFRELLWAALHCPRTAVTGPVRGVGPLTYRLTPVASPRLLAANLALLVHAVGKIDGRHVDKTIFMAYQVRGNVLSAVYVYPRGTAGIDAQRRVGLRAAEASAANLKRLVRN